MSLEILLVNFARKMSDLAGSFGVDALLFENALNDSRWERLLADLHTVFTVIVFAVSVHIF